MVTEAERAATERRDRVERYFNSTPKKWDQIKAGLLLLGALFCVGIALASLSSGGGLAFVCVVASVYMGTRGTAQMRSYLDGYRRAEPKPSGDELDRLLDADLGKIEAQAMHDLDLTAEDLETGNEPLDPVVAYGAATASPKRPILVFGPQPASGFAVGDDGVWRFRVYEVMVICPTHHHLALFRTELDFVTGGLFHDETQEYQYGHVVAVSTRTIPVPELTLDQVGIGEDDKNQVRFARIMLKKFEVGVSSGHTSAVTVGISDESDPTKEARLPASGIQHVITSVRRVLRDKGARLS